MDTVSRQIRILLCVFLCYPIPLTAEQAQDTKVIFLLDSTGSMSQPLGTDVKLDVSKRVFKALMEEMPETSRMGLIVFGNRQQSCDDIPISVALSVGSRDAIAREVKELKPLGTTPMALSIRIAGNYLIKNRIDATIVLVTDGEEQCGGDPLAEAAALRKSGLNIVLHVVGFSASPKVQAQLEKIAQMGGGTFYNARTEGDLKKALKDASGAQTKYLRLFSSSEQPLYSKVLHPIREGETLEIQFRPTQSVSGFGSHGIKLQIGASELEIQEKSGGWGLVLTSPRGNRVIPWPKALQLNKGQWNKFRIVKIGESCDILLNDTPLATIKEAAEAPPVKTGVQGFEVDVGAISVQFQPY